MIAGGEVHATFAGAVVALFIAGAVGATLYWMLHAARVLRAADCGPRGERARADGRQLDRRVLSEIDSSHMMALAVKLARGERSELLALYVIEVPYTLPPDAEMTLEERTALDALGAAETIANKNNVAVRTEIIKARSAKQAILDVAKREKANLIILGSFREGKYSGAPLGHTIEEIAADAKCDVLIGVEGKHGTLLMDESVQSNPQVV